MIDKADQGYRARVVNSPGGEAQSIFAAPVSSDDLETLADQLDRSRGTRKMATPQLTIAKEMGGRLHAAVICEDVRVSLARARDEAERDGLDGVRIRLHLDGAPELAVLPWELMFDADPKVGRFLALAEDTPLVRYVDLPERVRPLAVTPPLRVLGVVSNPADDRYPELDVEKEWRSLEEALAQPIQDGRLELLRLHRATVSALQDTLQSSAANVVHFIGHGRFDHGHQDGVLAFEGERGGVNEVSAERLGALLYNEKSLRLVVLNACEGGRASAADPYAGMAQTLVRMRIPAVVAMQFEITDRAAIVFARQFYKGIALGRPVDTAVTDARMAIYQQVSEVEWATPVLYMRSPDGRVFDVGATAQPIPSSVPTPAAARTSPAAPAAAATRGISREAALGGIRGTRTLSCVVTLALVLAVGGTIGLGLLGPPIAMLPGASARPTLAPTAATPTRRATPLPTLRVARTLTGFQQPDGIAVDETAERLYVVNSGQKQLLILDASTSRVLTTVPLSGQPVDVAANPALGRVYVTDHTGNAVAVFDTRGTPQGTVRVGVRPFAIAVDPRTNRVYVTNQNDSSISVIDEPSRRVTTIRVGTTPLGIAINTTTGLAYVANFGSNTVSVVDTARDQVIRTMPVDGAPARIAVSIRSDLVLTANAATGSLSVMSGRTGTVERVIPVGRDPRGILVDPASDRAYVALSGEGMVAVVDLAGGAVDHTVRVGTNPARFAFHTGSRQLYVTNFDAGTISVIL